MINFLLGLQTGYTKHPCFLCLWNSGVKHEHWVKKDWPPRQQMTLGENNVLYESLVLRDKIIFPQPHMKLGLMKQFVKESKLESKTWKSFVAVTKNFLGNKKSDDYVSLIQNMLDNYRDIGANINIKLHFLDSHLVRFPENCGDVSDEQGEQFHQDIKIMEERYQGTSDTEMMTDYCWSLKREEDRNYSQYCKRKFLPKMSSSFIG